MYDVERSDEEVNAVLNTCAEAEESGRSKYPGMTYEQGVANGIRWLLGEIDEHPIDE
jgi:hypothetical protein